MKKNYLRMYGVGGQVFTYIYMYTSYTLSEAVFTFILFLQSSGEGKKQGTSGMSKGNVHVKVYFLNHKIRCTRYTYIYIRYRTTLLAENIRIVRKCMSSPNGAYISGQRVPQNTARQEWKSTFNGSQPLRHTGILPNDKKCG